MCLENRPPGKTRRIGSGRRYLIYLKGNLWRLRTLAVSIEGDLGAEHDLIISLVS